MSRAFFELSSSPRFRIKLQHFRWTVLACLKINKYYFYITLINATIIRILGIYREELRIKLHGGKNKIHYNYSDRYRTGFNKKKKKNDRVFKYNQNYIMYNVGFKIITSVCHI